MAETLSQQARDYLRRGRSVAAALRKMWRGLRQILDSPRSADGTTRETISLARGVAAEAFQVSAEQIDSWDDRGWAAAVLRLFEQDPPAARTILDWYDSAAAVVVAFRRARDAEIDAAAAARHARLDAVWDRTVKDTAKVFREILDLPEEVIREVGRVGGEILRGAGSAVGGGVGAFFKSSGLIGIVVAIVVIWLLLSKRGTE